MLLFKDRVFPSCSGISLLWKILIAASGSRSAGVTSAQGNWNLPLRFPPICNTLLKWFSLNPVVKSQTEKFKTGFIWTSKMSVL